MWTDADRTKIRPYMIYVGRTLEVAMVCDLADATRFWKLVCKKYPSSKVTLYSDRVAHEEICCEQNAELFPGTRDALNGLGLRKLQAVQGEP